MLSRVPHPSPRAHKERQQHRAAQHSIVHSNSQEAVVGREVWTRALHITRLRRMRTSILPDRKSSEDCRMTLCGIVCRGIDMVEGVCRRGTARTWEAARAGCRLIDAAARCKGWTVTRSLIYSVSGADPSIRVRSAPNLILTSDESGASLCHSEYEPLTIEQ